MQLVDALQFTDLAEYHASYSGHDGQEADQPGALGWRDPEIIGVFHLMRGKYDSLSVTTRQSAFCKTTLEAELTLTNRQAKPVGEENEFVSTEDRPTLQL